MIAQNAQQPQDVFAMELVKNHDLTLRQLQLALQHAAREDLALDVVLLELKAASKTALAMAAKAAAYVLTAEQPANLQVPKDGSRAFVRHATKLVVQFNDLSDLEIAYTNNISRGGLAVTLPASAEAPAEDSVLSLALNLPNEGSIEIKSRVMYSRLSGEHHHLGLQLHPDDMKAMLEIDRLLSQQSS
ncbi:MAG: PilZ domain-containing protein [Myxococcales bacterium]|nr:PilZ domain-containing protein [Myxococcales bacterium]